MNPRSAVRQAVPLSRMPSDVQHATLQISSFHVSAHGGMPGPSILLRFAGPIPDVTYIDTMAVQGKRRRQ